MTGAKQENSELDFDRGLGSVGIVVENIVGADLVDDAVEGAGVNADSPPVLIEVASMPVFKEVEL